MWLLRAKLISQNQCLLESNVMSQPASGPHRRHAVGSPPNMRSAASNDTNEDNDEENIGPLPLLGDFSSASDLPPPTPRSKRSSDSEIPSSQKRMRTIQPEAPAEPRQNPPSQISISHGLRQHLLGTFIQENPRKDKEQTEDLDIMPLIVEEEWDLARIEATDANAILRHQIPSFQKTDLPQITGSLIETYLRDPHRMRPDWYRPHRSQEEPYNTDAPSRPWYLDLSQFSRFVQTVVAQWPVAHDAARFEKFAHSETRFVTDATNNAFNEDILVHNSTIPEVIKRGSVVVFKKPQRQIAQVPLNAETVEQADFVADVPLVRSLLPVHGVLDQLGTAFTGILNDKDAQARSRLRKQRSYSPIIPDADAAIIAEFQDSTLQGLLIPAPEKPESGLKPFAEAFPAAFGAAHIQPAMVASQDPQYVKDNMETIMKSFSILVEDTYQTLLDHYTRVERQKRRTRATAPLPQANAPLSARQHHSPNLYEQSSQESSSENEESDSSSSDDTSSSSSGSDWRKHRRKNDTKPRPQKLPRYKPKAAPPTTKFVASDLRPLSRPLQISRYAHDILTSDLVGFATDIIDQMLVEAEKVGDARRRAILHVESLHRLTKRYSLVPDLLLNFSIPSSLINRIRNKISAVYDNEAFQGLWPVGSVDSIRMFRKPLYSRIWLPDDIANLVRYGQTPRESISKKVQEAKKKQNRSDHALPRLNGSTYANLPTSRNSSVNRSLEQGSSPRNNIPDISEIGSTRASPQPGTQSGRSAASLPTVRTNPKLKALLSSNSPKRPGRPRADAPKDLQYLRSAVAVPVDDSDSDDSSSDWSSSENAPEIVSDTLPSPSEDDISTHESQISTDIESSDASSEEDE